MAKRVPGWRAAAGLAWPGPRDPRFFGDLDVDASGLLGYIEQVRQRSGVRLTVIQLVGRAVAHGLVMVPALQRRPARGRQDHRAGVDVTILAAPADGSGLVWTKIRDADRKSAIELGQELARRRAGPPGAEVLERDRGERLLARLGMPRQPFGAAVIAPVDGWGMSRVYAPPARSALAPVLVFVGAVQPRPAAVAGEVVVRPVLTLTATFSQPHLDGAHAAGFTKAVREYCEQPAAFEPPAARAGQSVPAPR